MGARLTAALLAGRTAAGLSRRFGLVAAPSSPATLSPESPRRALPASSRRLPRGSIVISGTNGKTTTARLLAICCAVTASGRSTIEPAPTCSADC